MTLWELIKEKKECPRCSGTGTTDRGYGDIINACDQCNNEGFIE